MGASLRFAPGRPLTASFPGKIGTYRKDVANQGYQHLIINGYPRHIRRGFETVQIKTVLIGATKFGQQHPRQRG